MKTAIEKYFKIKENNSSFQTFFGSDCIFYNGIPAFSCSEYTYGCVSGGI